MEGTAINCAIHEDGIQTSWFYVQNNSKCIECDLENIKVQLNYGSNVGRSPSVSRDVVRQAKAN